MRSIYVDIARNFGATVRAMDDKNARVNYEKYLKDAIDGDQLHRACAYGVSVDSEADDFISMLQKVGYEVKYKPARLVYNKSTDRREPKINLTSNNVNIVMDIVKDINKVDTIILGSNDIDLIPLIIWAQNYGVKVHIFSLMIPKIMKEVANSWQEISEDIID